MIIFVQYNFVLDTFNLKYTSSPETVSLLRTGIAWVSDKKEKFNNPSSELS
jgi:hypothetical protein